MQVAALEPHVDLEVGHGAAVSHGVRHRLFDAQDDGVDDISRDAVLVEVVSDALARAQQPRGVERQAEVEAGAGASPCYDAIHTVSLQVKGLLL